MRGSFQKWCPCEELSLPGMGYDVAQVSIGREGFSFCLVSDGGEKEKRWLFSFEQIVAYQLSEETYRQDCWVKGAENAWPFYRSGDSAYLAYYRQNSPLLPENTVHYRLVGTNLIADILSHTEPIIKKE